MQLTFLGATGTVTGSKYLLNVDNQKILIDCGLFQGYKKLRLRNWEPLPIDPASLDAVVITHAHIDHTGYLPLLVKNGFSGPIYATEATYDLCSILLPDSGHIQEEDARRANRYSYSKHHPALPLYTKLDAQNALKNFKVVNFNEAQSILSNGTVTWFPAGHILGSAFIQFHVDGKKLLFTGDIGRLQDPVMKPPATIQMTDYLVIESTYGNRLHDVEDPKERIRQIVVDTAKRGGTILIPAFAVGRAQSLLYYIYRLQAEASIPSLPVFLDSPMAVNATKMLCKHAREHQLSHDECTHVCNVATYVNTPDESKSIDEKPMPKIIISASGMATGGRILHHLKAFVSDSRNTILFTGFQAAGTRGEKLVAGASVVKIHGHEFPVHARIENLTNTSAHADYEEIVKWLKQYKQPPKKVFITHGEPEAAIGLKTQIESELDWECCIPNYLDEEML